MGLTAILKADIAHQVPLAEFGGSAGSLLGALIEVLETANSIETVSLGNLFLWPNLRTPWQPARARPVAW